MQTSTRGSSGLFDAEMDRIVRGDFQTPIALARRCLETIEGSFATIVEPTCGRGAWLRAAAERWPTARRLGWELDPVYVTEASTWGEIRCADAFAVDWAAEAARWARPVLIVGNPPWVTTGRQGRLGAENRPRKGNVGLRGLDAVTGISNFDVAEWLMGTLVRAAPDATMAMLAKVSVGRRLLAAGMSVAEIAPIDAPRWFGAAVDAGWIRVEPGARRCRIGDRGLVVVDGQVVDEASVCWAHLAGSGPAWRSGVKHDAARILELTEGRNALGEAVEVEPAWLWPLLKGGDVHAGRPATRRLLLPQRSLGEDTSALRGTRVGAYLERHGAVLDGRRSRVYAGRPRFAVFGVGAYTFAPWKVAVAGLYPDARFRVVGPVDGRPVLLDDTCYFLPFAAEADAREAHRRLTSEAARAFLSGRIQPGKRPITARLLRSLDLDRLG